MCLHIFKPVITQDIDFAPIEYTEPDPAEVAQLTLDQLTLEDISDTETVIINDENQDNLEAMEELNYQELEAVEIQYTLDAYNPSFFVNGNYALYTDHLYSFQAEQIDILFNQYFPDQIGPIMLSKNITKGTFMHFYDLRKDLPENFFFYDDHLIALEHIYCDVLLIPNLVSGNNYSLITCRACANNINSWDCVTNFDYSVSYVKENTSNYLDDREYHATERIDATMEFKYGDYAFCGRCNKCLFVYHPDIIDDDGFFTF